ncbi:unnamed protein product [Trichogramma brassicae]|uniref:Uncharacterized protein n=1 Tax=Trichogramma brassicae TaxID=86971 RepID=A0A6H5IR42_9HYME|nr:unnamed protein product [Trichogramma brassicae]
MPQRPLSQPITTSSRSRGRRRRRARRRPPQRLRLPTRSPKVKAHRRPRHDVVVVKAKDPKSYSEILKLLRSEPSLQDSVGSVNKVRRSTNGDMLLQLTRTCVDPGELGQRLNDVIGELGAATTRSPVTAIEIKDLDEVTSKEEICEALWTHLDAAKLGPDAVRSLRKAFAGTQTAVVTLPVQLAAKAIKLGRVRIGLSQEEFIGLLNNIVDEARGKNANPRGWRLQWLGQRSGGSRETKPRGRALLNALATLDVLLLKHGSKPTFVGEQGESVIDLTFAGVSLFNRVESWQVLAVLRRATVGGAHEVSTAIALLRSCLGWRSGRVSQRTWWTNLCPLSRAHATPPCPERVIARRRESAYWWNDDIAECRRDCIRARRCAQRARVGRPDEVIRREEFANARRAATRCD